MTKKEKIDIVSHVKAVSKENKNSDINQDLLIVLKNILSEIKKTTSYNSHNIKPMSILQMCPIYSDLVNNLVKNRRHLKKDSMKDTLKELFEKLSEALKSQDFDLDMLLAKRGI